jgi:hypothetical protein
VKGIAPLLIAILAFAAVGSGLVLSTVMRPSGNDSSVTNASGPVEIGTNAVSHVPWGDVYDYFFGGLIGLMRWLSNYFIMPIVNWGSSAALSILKGEPVHVELPWYLGYVILFLVLIMIFYWKWNAIWDFVMSKTILALAISIGVIVLIVALAMLGGH